MSITSLLNVFGNDFHADLQRGPAGEFTLSGVIRTDIVRRFSRCRNPTSVIEPAHRIVWTEQRCRCGQSCFSEGSLTQSNAYEKPPSSCHGGGVFRRHQRMTKQVTNHRPDSKFWNMSIPIAVAGASSTSNDSDVSIQLVTACRAASWIVASESVAKTSCFSSA